MKKNIILLSTLIILLNCNSKKEDDKSTVVKQNSIVKKEITPKENKNDKKGEVSKQNKLVDTLPPKILVRNVKDYKSKIELFLKKDFSEKDNYELIEALIPVSEEEYREFYGLSQSNDSNLEKFDKLNELILSISEKDKGEAFFRFMNMADFVDGEYAEGYYADIENMVPENQKRFCFLYKHISKPSKDKLEDLFVKYCKD